MRIWSSFFSSVPTIPPSPAVSTVDPRDRQDLLGSVARFRAQLEAGETVALTKVFFDTEFTEFRGGQLLSIGMVTASGTEFYVERADHSRMDVRQDFVRDTVLTLFGRVPGAGAQGHREMTGRISDFLLSLPAPVEVLYDHKLDRHFLVEALVASGRWAEHWARTTESNIGGQSNSDAARTAATASFSDSAAAGLLQHHALADARALRAAWLTAHDGERLTPIATNTERPSATRPTP
ncbi:3'-5' exoribonuclease [Pseudorhodoferax sp. Leaf267]|uniref:3'-5' exoribonuclease n=1 Tax=Pseudorhodoferax sp. Leaf267 TaxID=1736316 RepID=UPI0007138C28|nr:3'-5' exoribonuclease [Pseudorhodoferax sp. Leaf267]KQP22834.1 hypothetical protein ASF43_02765 [Pseudorhodoferax sp. Leaf267]